MAGARRSGILWGMNLSSRTWALRITWAALAVAPPWTMFEDRSGAVRAVLGGWGWGSWAIVAVAIAVVSPWSLTLARIGAPVMVVFAMAAVLERDATGLVTWSAAVLSVVSWWLVCSTDVCADMVQGAAYGDELRLPLRTPVPHLAPAIVAWALLVGSAGCGSLLLASGRWVAGGVSTAVAAVLCLVVPRRLHRLARRWLVFVPAGIVVHDHLVLGESLMVRATTITERRQIPGPGDEADLTGGVFGRRFRLSVREPEKVVLAPITARILGTSEGLHVTSFAVAPRTPRRHSGRLSG